MIRRLASSATTAAAVVVLAAVPAHADDEIGLSSDGVSWAEQLSAPLFSPGFRFVPGDVEVRSFRVRNQGPTDGVLTVRVVAADPDVLLADDDVTLEARVGSGPWVDVEVGTTPVATDLEVARGARTRVALRASFDWDSTRQVQQVPFRVRLTLSEDGDVGGVDEGDGDGSGDGDGGSVGGEVDALPETGAPFGPGPMWVAAGCIGAGLALVRRRRDDARPPAVPATSGSGGPVQ